MRIAETLTLVVLCFPLSVPQARADGSPAPPAADAMPLQEAAASSPATPAERSLPPAARAPGTALALSLRATVLPIAAGFALGTGTGTVSEVVGGSLIVTGMVAGPATGLVYGRCYWHALAGTGLRVVGLSAVAAGWGWGMEGADDRARAAMWGGLALCGASTLYDLLTVSRCTERHNPKASASLVPLVGAVSLRGTPGLAVTMHF